MIQAVTQKKVIGIIPARGGSKGIPRKNVAPLCGKPLISYVIKAVLESGAVDSLVVSSDDDEILTVAEGVAPGGLHLIKRPSDLAIDSAPSLPVIQHAVRETESTTGFFYDYVVMFQCTTPLVSSDDIRNAMDLLKSAGADSVMSVYETNESHPAKAKKLLEGNRLKQYCPEIQEHDFTRQNFVPVYRRNGAIYASKRSIVMDQGRLYGGDDIDTRGYCMPEERSIDINTPLDLLVAEALLRAAGLCE